VTEDERSTRAELEQRVDSLESQTDVDHRVIEELQAEIEIDKEKIANLEVALRTARRIGSAMGVLMATQKVTENEAFDMLRNASQTENRKLRDVAQDVVDTGTLGAY
jgi:AmiR/NasT family two-component response regulator